MDMRRKPSSWNLAQYMTITSDTERVDHLTPRDTTMPTQHKDPLNNACQKFVDELCYQEPVRSGVNFGLDMKLPYSPDQQISMDDVGQRGSGYFTSVVDRELGVVNGTSSASIASVLPSPVPQIEDVEQMEDGESTYGPFIVASVSEDSFVFEVPDIENLPARYSMSQVRQNWAARHCVNPSAPGYVPPSVVSLLLIQTHYVVRREYLAQEETAVEDSQTWFTHRSLGLLGKKVESSMKTMLPTQSLIDSIFAQAAKLAVSPLEKMGKKVRTVADKVDKAAEKVKKIAETGKIAE